MSESRKGEIALKLHKHRLHTEGVRVGKGARHKIQDLAREIGVSADELHEFSMMIAQELIQETYSKETP